MRCLPLALLLLCSAVAEGRVRPAKREYDSHAYYVLELDRASSPRDVAALLGAQLVEQVGELRDHYLLRIPHSFNKRDGHAPRDIVMERYYDLVNPSHLHTRDTVQHTRSIVSLERQVVRKRAKRDVAYMPSNHWNILRRQATPKPTLMADLAQQFAIKDPIWAEQWHLANDQIQGYDINVTGVWQQGITGKGINVAVVDDGLDMESDDLSPNFFAEGSWDYNDHTDLPKPRLSDDQHGTRCCGEIAAAKNDVCGIGVAYESGIAGIRILSGSISDADEASALNFGYQENDIYSCSWGPPDDGRSMDEPSRLIKKAMINGIQNGRGGKGSVFVFASGNGGAVDDQCNFDGYTNSIYSITISAIDRKGLHPFYSEGCSANMAVTYSSGSGDHIHTTDVGKNKCTKNHGGTSAAAPIAAGMYALVLSARPELTWRDLQHISVHTAIPVNENDPDWQTTAAGRKFNHKYGYGKLDAYRLVEHAKTFKMVTPQAWYFSQIAPSNQTITKDGIGTPISVTANDIKTANIDKLEHITVVVNIKHQRRGDVVVALTSPHGITSILARKRRFDEDKDGFGNWTFMSVKHWDEDPIGEWTLKVSDQGNTNNGTFLDWQLRLWGSSVDASKAVQFKLPEDDKIILPFPPHHSSTLESIPDEHKPTKVHPKPTDHLPDDHGHATGESDHPLEATITMSIPSGKPTDYINDNEKDPGDTSPSEASAIPADSNMFSNGMFSSLLNNTISLIVIASAVLIFGGALLAFFLYRRFKRTRGDSRNRYDFQPVADDENDVAMRSMEGASSGRSQPSGGGGRTRQLYDAFAIDDSEESDQEEPREARYDDRYTDSFLEEESQKPYRDDDEVSSMKSSTPDDDLPPRETRTS